MTLLAMVLTVAKEHVFCNVILELRTKVIIERDTYKEFGFVEHAS
jgi:hypothetical protein